MTLSESLRGLRRKLRSKFFGPSILPQHIIMEALFHLPGGYTLVEHDRLPHELHVDVRSIGRWESLEAYTALVLRPATTLLAREMRHRNVRTCGMVPLPKDVPWAEQVSSHDLGLSLRLTPLVGRPKGYRIGLICG